VQDLLKIYGSQLKTEKVQPKPEVTAPSRASDDVVISGAGKLKQRAINAAKQSDDVRTDKVEELKQAIATGSYAVSDDEVAESMIYQAVIDKMV
jgi:negative regulator of flagellin synthesis FlgM